MVGGDKDAAAANMAMLWILNLSDGMHSLLDIAERANFAIRNDTKNRAAAATPWAFDELRDRRR